jgi:hypothetical protein
MGGEIMPKEKLPIDGPAGRNEVTENYRDNYDSIFRKSTTLYHCGRKVLEALPGGGFKTFPKKSQKGGGDHAE